MQGKINVTLLSFGWLRKLAGGIMRFSEGFHLPEVPLEQFSIDLEAVG
jgi:hypothetical protein